MPTNQPALRNIAQQLDDTASLGRAIDELIAAAPPTILALGEPTHGIAAFPLLRNELLGLLVNRGYRSIALETDIFAGDIVNNYVDGGPGDIDAVLATGFSHSFGNVPGNRELVQWLRHHNAERTPRDRVRFYGFDAPVETAAAPSPRQSLAAVIDYLPTTMRPAADLDALLGDEHDWTNGQAMFDPAASIGSSERVHELRIAADDLASSLRRCAPVLQPADPAGFVNATANARTAQGLLRYHAAMASTGSDRIATLISLRAEMMADNLLAIAAQEQRRGPTMVFAHNAHLQRQPSTMTMGEDVSWCSAGAIVAGVMGQSYAYLASDANSLSKPSSLQGMLAAATDRRAMFSTDKLREILPSTIDVGEPMVPGHLPLRPTDLESSDAVIFVADTDGQRVQYWLGG